MKRIEQTLLDRRRARQRHTCEKSGIEAQRDRGDRGQHRQPHASSNPFADAERILECGENPASNQQREGERRGRTSCIGHQEQCCLHVCALQRSARENQPENGPRTRRPEQSGRHAEQQRRRQVRAACRRRAVGRLGQPSAQTDERIHEPVGQRGKQQRQSKQRQEGNRQSAPILVGVRGPTSADSRQRRHRRERCRHADEQRQPGAHEGSIRPRKHERQDRKNAWTHDREHAADVDQYQQGHGVACRLRRPSA